MRCPRFLRIPHPSYTLPFNRHILPRRRLRTSIYHWRRSASPLTVERPSSLSELSPPLLRLCNRFGTNPFLA